MLSLPLVVPTAAGQPIIAVVGGTGFIGSRVCRSLVEDCACSKVLSISRNGRIPEWADGQAWTSKVSWQTIDLASDDAGLKLTPLLDNVDGVVSCVGTSNVYELTTDGRKEGVRAYRFERNGPPNVMVVDAAKKAGASRFVYIAVAADVETALAGAMPGVFDGKRLAMDAVRSAFPDTAHAIFGPHSVYDAGSNPVGAAAQAALSTGAARGLINANRLIGNLGWRGEDFLTKARLMPPCPVAELGLAVALAVCGAADIEQSVRTVRIDDGVEVSAEGRHVDGTEAILRVAKQAVR